MTDLNKKEYEKLSGARYWFKYLRLWLASDHLLLCESTGYTENYKRFYLRDIQAVLVRHHTRRFAWNLVWGACFAFSMGLMAALHQSHSPAWWILEALSLLMFLANNVLGSGCLCHIKTAVQTVELPVTRLRKAKKIINRLKPLIEEAQQNLPQVPAPVPVEPLSVASGTPTGGIPPAAVKKAFRSQTHRLLFIFLCLEGFAMTVLFFKQTLSVYMTAFVLELGSIVLLVAALIQQAQSEVPQRLRKVTVVTLGCLILNFIFGSIMGFMFAMKHPQLAQDRWELIKWAATQAPTTSAFHMAYFVFDIAYCFILGAIGLVVIDDRQGLK